LIERQATGTPAEFAVSVNISRRHLYNIIEGLKDNGAKIKYSRISRTFFYEEIFILQNLHNQIAELQVNTESCSQNTVVLLAQIADLQADTANLYLQNTNLQNQLGEANQSITTLQSDLLTTNNANITLQMQITDLQNQLSAANQSISTLQSDLATANNTINTLQTDNATLQRDLATANDTLSSLQTQIESLNNQIAALQAQLEDCQNGANSVSTPEASAVQIYPNPVREELYIKSDLPIKKVEVYSLTGTLLLSENNFNEKLSLSALPASVYLLKVYTDKGTKTERFIKK
jgi:predicted  nucleic acid-binding Zn-ribbon protein